MFGRARGRFRRGAATNGFEPAHGLVDPARRTACRCQRSSLFSPFLVLPRLIAACLDAAEPRSALLISYGGRVADMASHSRGAMRPSSTATSALEKQKAQGDPQTEGAGKCRVPAAPAARVQRVEKHTVVTTGSPDTRHSLRDGFKRLIPRSCVQKICQNVRTGGSHQPARSLDLSPIVLEGQESLSGSVGQSRCLPLTRTVARALEPEPSKEGSWMMAQNDLVVAGIDVAKEKVDVCIRSLSLKRTFASTAEDRRDTGLVAAPGIKSAKAVMEASGGYERDLGQDATCRQHRGSDRRSEAGFAALRNRPGGSPRMIRSMPRLIAWFAETFAEARGPVLRCGRASSFIKWFMRVRP